MKVMKEELLKYLVAADAEDLKKCLIENFTAEDQERHYRMLAEVYWNSKPHFDVLSAGCKAAMLIYLFLGVK